MADTPSSSILSPSHGSSTPRQNAGPDLSQEVRSAMPGLEGAIELASAQGSGGKSDKKPVAAQQSATSSKQKADTSQPETPVDVQSLSEETLLRETRKKITQLLSNLDATAEKIMRSNSKSKASNFARIIANMRQLNISLSTLYRMSLDKVRALYSQIR